MHAMAGMIKQPFWAFCAGYQTQRTLHQIVVPLMQFPADIQSSIGSCRYTLFTQQVEFPKFPLTLGYKLVAHRQPQDHSLPLPLLLQTTKIEFTMKIYQIALFAVALPQVS